MSAYMVNREHVGYLVDAAMDYRIVQHHTMRWYHDGTGYELSVADYDRAAEVGQMLWDANKESIQARYPDTRDDFSRAPEDSTEDYVYDRHDARIMEHFDPVQVLMSIRCFDYQACEYEGWQTSEARAFLDALESHAIAALPGMEDAVWGAPPRKHPEAKLVRMGSRKRR